MNTVKRYLSHPLTPLILIILVSGESLVLTLCVKNIPHDWCMAWVVSLLQLIPGISIGIVYGLLGSSGLEVGFLKRPTFKIPGEIAEGEGVLCRLKGHHVFTRPTSMSIDNVVFCIACKFKCVVIEEGINNRVIRPIYGSILK